MSETHPSAVVGRVFNIQRFSIHDGPGIRTTVFVKGCPMRCTWCHNPEGISPDVALSFMPDKCIGCGCCLRACPRGAHSNVGGRHVLDRQKCRACGMCAAECYAGALEMVGYDISAADALAEVLRDRPFYETSGGGLTISGGEPLMQIDFTAALLAAARAEGLHCCVETCGHADWSRLERIVHLVDLFFYDVKDMDDARHVECTGVSNERALANLRQLHGRRAKIVLRLPIVPGCNDRDDHFSAVAALAASMPGLGGVEIMPYHGLGEAKRARLGLPASTMGRTSNSDELLPRWIERFRELGVQVVNEPRGQRPAHVGPS